MGLLKAMLGTGKIVYMRYREIVLGDSDDGDVADAAGNAGRLEDLGVVGPLIRLLVVFRVNSCLFVMSFISFIRYFFGRQKLWCGVNNTEDRAG